MEDPTEATPRKTGTPTDAAAHTVPEAQPGPGPETPTDEATGPPEALARNGRALAFHILFGILGAFLVLNFLGGILLGVLQIFFADAALTQRLTPGLGESDPATLLWGSITNLVAFGLLPLAWVYGTRVRPWPGGNRYLGFHDAPRDLARGLALGLGLMLVVMLASLLLTLATDGPDGLRQSTSETDNPVVQAILDNLSLPLALVIALTAGFGEEVLFRGVLQKWVGWWPQAILFGLSHAVGGEPMQILVTALLGLLFGWLVHKGHSLWLVIAAHFSYDLGLLLVALAAG